MRRKICPLVINLDCLPIVNYQTVVIQSQQQRVCVLGDSYNVGIEIKFFVERKDLLFECVGKQIVVDSNE